MPDGSEIPQDALSLVKWLDEHVTADVTVADMAEEFPRLHRASDIGKRELVDVLVGIYRVK